MSTATHAENWSRVTRRDPCPICDKPDWCEVRDDGAIVACNRVREGSYRTVTTGMGELYYHRLTDDRPFTPPTPKAKPQTTHAFDPLAARAVYALVLEHSRIVPPEALADLVRRFGPVHGPQAAEVFSIGWCDPSTLVAALDAAGRRQDAIMAGVLWRNGEVARSLANRHLIPYLRGGVAFDLRGSGVKGSEGGTKEMSLAGSYADRGVDNLLFNHDALRRCGVGGTLHLAGGAFKCMALHMAGLHAAGTRGESELSEGQVTEIVAAGIAEVVIHIDSEKPKPGDTLSMARKLAMPKGERLVAAGLRVKIAEPPRERDGAKVDPDSLLRDYGPGMVRAYAESALPLEAFKVAIGVESVGVPAAVATALETLQERLHENERLQVAMMHVQRNKHIKTEKPTLLAATYLYNSEASRGKSDADGWVPITRAALAEIGGVSEGVAGDHLERIADWDRGIHKDTRFEEVRFIDGEGVVRVERRKRLYLKVDGKPADVLMPLGGEFNPPRPIDKATGKELGTHGGPRCPKCGGTRRRTVTYCADCGEVLKETITDSAPNPMTNEELVAAVVAESRPDEPRPDAPSVPPTVVEPASRPTYPPGPVTYERAIVADDEPDDWDPYECNHGECKRRSLPGKRWCDWHSPERRARFAQQAQREPTIAVSTPPPESAPVSQPVPPRTSAYEVEPIDWGAVPLGTERRAGVACHLCDAGTFERPNHPILCGACLDAMRAELLLAGGDVAAGGG